MRLERKKYAWDDKPFINKTLWKVIMQQIRLREKFLNNPTDENKLLLLIKDFFLSLLRKEKKTFCKSQRKSHYR